MTKLEGRIIAFDLETTGAAANTDRIVQFAWGYYQDGDLKDGVTKLFRPTIPISPGAQRVHGISMEMLADEPLFAEDAAEYREIFAAADGFMGYNVGFDLTVLQAELRRSGLSELDLSQVAIYDAYLIWTKHEGRSLSHAVERFLGHEMESAHDAMADITATVGVFDKMVEEFDLSELDAKQFTAIFKREKVDFGGTFRWEEGEVVLGIGKHRGHKATDVGRNTTYLQWLIGADFPPDAKAVAKQAILLHAQPQSFRDWVVDRFGTPPE